MIYQRLAKVFLICSDEQIDPFADPALRIAMQKREQLLRDLDLLLGDLSAIDSAPQTWLPRAMF
jgi:hypothetical protein